MGEANFHGHEPRECGEHRTVGSHRAWCFDCSEWCYPKIPCVRCMNPDALMAERDALREALSALVKKHHPHSGLCVMVERDGTSRCFCDETEQRARAALDDSEEAT